MPLLTQTDDLSIQRVECGEQRGRAVPLVVVRHGGAPAAFEGQADDRLQFLDELGIVADLEALHQMGFQAMRSPDPPNGGLADSRGGGHGAGAPMRSVQRLLLGRLPNDLLDQVSRDTGCAARPRRILLQARQTRSKKPGAPACRLLGRDLQGGRDLQILLAIGRQQHDAGALHQTSRERARSGPLLKGLALFGIQEDGPGNTHASEPLYCTDGSKHISVTSSGSLH